MAAALTLQYTALIRQHLAIAARRVIAAICVFCVAALTASHPVIELALTLYNTLTRRKEPFEPIDSQNVRMYACGPTVYDFAHIGNARPIIVFDVLYRLLRHLYPGSGQASDGSRVEYVRNITDVDDKINARAAQLYPDLTPTDAIRKLTTETTAQFHADIAALGVLSPTQEPRATENIAGMIDIIASLVAKGHAYEARDEVLFDVASMPDYGRLSGRNLDDQKAGARVAVEAHKKNPADFVLWKKSSPEQPGWESPWGWGRPGWHIECSAMAGRYLGRVFDIHGGGLDLIFPHHENEIAQSRCAHGTSVMANVWMHNGFLEVEGAKMSKSVGNFVTINELLETTKFGGRKWPGEVLRLAMLMTHYREPIDFSVARLEEAAAILDRWSDVAFATDTGAFEPLLPDGNPVLDDLNTPLFVTQMHGLHKSAKSGDGNARKNFRLALKLLGFDDIEVHSGANQLTALQLAPTVDPMVAARSEARRRKDFKESDRIRDELAAMGIALKDTKNKETGEIETTWEIAR